MTKSAQRWVLAGVVAQKGGFQHGFQQGFQRRKGVPARLQQRVPAQRGVPPRGSSRGSGTFVSPLFPCISAQMPLLAPLVDWAKAARVAVGTRGYACPDGFGCMDLAAYPDTKVAIPSGTIIAGIRLTRPLLSRSEPSTCLALEKGCTDLGRTRCTMRRMGGACGMACGGGKVLEEMRFRSPP